MNTFHKVCVAVGGITILIVLILQLKTLETPDVFIATSQSVWPEHRTGFNYNLGDVVCTKSKSNVCGTIVEYHPDHGSHTHGNMYKVRMHIDETAEPIHLYEIELKRPL